MLKISIYDKNEFFDEETQMFVKPKLIMELSLEHSLVSISKWESKWHKPFLDTVEKTEEEILDYIRCMTINQNVPDEIYLNLSNKNVIEIKKYMEDSHTATWFNSYRDNKKSPRSKKSEVMTAEVIYYYMFSCQIPKECEKWHINRLLTLIRIFSIKNNTESNKMSNKETLSRNAKLNAARRQAMKSRG